jgi:streptogramin lyase
MRTVLLGALLVLLALPGSAAADPVLDGQFDVSDKPGRIAPGPDGNVWFTLGGTKEFGRITPDGIVTEYDTPANQIVTDLVAGSGNRMWLAINGGVIEWDIAAATGTAHAIAAIENSDGITRDPDGNLWIVDRGLTTPGVVKVDETGALVQDVQVAGSDGRDIDLGPDGRVWWTDFNGGAVRATDTGPPFATQTIPVGVNPQDVKGAPIGQIAFSDPGADPQTVGRLSPAGASLGTIPAPGTDPFGIAFGGDGAFWVAQFNSDSLLRLAPGGQTSPLAMPAASGPRRVTAGPGNTLWVSLETAEKVARVSGVVPPPAPPAPPGGPPPASPPGGPLLPAADTTRPALTGLSVTPNRFRRGARGVRVRFTLSEPAAVVLRFERAQAGRRSGRRCVAPSRRLRRARPCTRWRAAGTLRRSARAGRTSVVLGGRVGGRTLAAGRHRVTATATDAAGNRSRPRTASFSVLRRR